MVARRRRPETSRVTLRPFLDRSCKLLRVRRLLSWRRFLRAWALPRPRPRNTGVQRHRGLGHDDKRSSCEWGGSTVCDGRRDRDDLPLVDVSGRSRARQAVGGLHDDLDSRAGACDRVDPSGATGRGPEDVRGTGACVLLPARGGDLRTRRRSQGRYLGSECLRASSSVTTSPRVATIRRSPASTTARSVGRHTRTFALRRPRATSIRVRRISVITCSIPVRRSPRVTACAQRAAARASAGVVGHRHAVALPRCRRAESHRAGHPHAVDREHNSAHYREADAEEFAP